MRQDDRRVRVSRRRFLLRSALVSGGAALLAGAGRPATGSAPRPVPGAKDSARVAALITEYRPWSHADVIVGRFIQGYRLDVTPHRSPVGIRAMYVDQFPPSDLSRPLSRHYGIPIAGTIRDAILDEEGRLAVDGVLIIGEHGNYPRNERGQHLYPRRRFFEETVAAFREAGAVVPVFNDKHLAALWKDGKFMYETAKELQIPFMAGSSLPLAWRRPWLEIPMGARMKEALVVAYGGMESYGFHGLETLQCMVERRAGGETGVRAVQCVEGEDVWKALEEKRLSRHLLEAALARHAPPADRGYRSRCRNPAAFLIEYLDGLRASCLMLNGAASQFLFAADLEGYAQPVSTLFWLQEPRFGHFSYLSNAIMGMYLTGKPSYPVERTVLTTGILATAMDSRFEDHRRIETPDLAIPYRPVDHRLSAHRHPEAENARDGGWIELFNGRDLDGWLVHEFAHEPKWSVNDGILTGSGGQGYLATTEEFEDFELFAELRISDRAGGRGNSGIYFRCALHEDHRREYPDGYEAQCDHGDARNPTGSIYNLGVPGARAPKPDVADGQWFTLRIRAEGNHIRTWVDGEPAADVKDPEERFRRGYVLLQMHHRTGVVEFREVRIRRIRRI